MAEQAKQPARAELVPEVTVVVHPWQGQWRWAVQVGGAPPGDLAHCAGSGILPDEPRASYHGEQAGSTATKALRALGVPARYGYLRLGYDPLPADADQQPLGVWHGQEE